jgi:hypothetical protein
MDLAVEAIGRSLITEENGNCHYRQFTSSTFSKAYASHTMQRKGLDDEQCYNLARNKFCVQTHSVACRRLILLDTLCNLDNVCDTARN